MITTATTTTTITSPNYIIHNSKIWKAPTTKSFDYSITTWYK
jgi:hypothetical protein